jgi:hypothetical protein
MLAGATAEAADQCFQDTETDQVYVAKALTLPTANNCKTVNGYISGVASAVAGTVCKTKNNAFYYFNLQVNNGVLDIYSVVFNVNASSLLGSGRKSGGIFAPSGTFTDFGISKVTCPPDRFFGF